ncbi:hypothetical protein AB0D91_32265 [Streptomyces canus]|uniref:hypothetical protein n=1 Tax=Streptomyces canus TaxID=58343 RepID=UPI0033EF0DE8
MEQLNDDGVDADTEGSDDERAEYDFRTERAVWHAEFIAVAQDFARRMIEGGRTRKPGCHRVPNS